MRRTNSLIYPVAYLMAVAAAAQQPADEAVRPDTLVINADKLLDDIWQQLSTHDAFFDPNSRQNRVLFREARRQLDEATTDLERLRSVVRLLARLGDGHLRLTTRWFLPDHPPPPLPLAGDEPLFRPAVGFERFHRDYFLRLPKSEGQADGTAPAGPLRVRRVDGAPVAHGGGWALLDGPEDTTVELELQTLDGQTVIRRFQRTVPVEPPKYFAPTTQQVIKDPNTGEAREVTREVVIEARRLEGNLGYIRVEHLVTMQVIADFHQALDELMDTDGLLLDLRDTHGGYPWIMMPIAGRFFSKPARVCSFDGRSPLISGMLRSVGQVGIAPVGHIYTKPLVVLINDGTASMSEGLAFALGDTGRAKLVGRPTMGLNAAIRNVTLSSGLVLWHSWIRVDRVGKGHYQGVGVEPHERVELSDEELGRLGLSEARREESKRQFERAVELLREAVRRAK